MSRHRETVTQLVDEIGARATAAVTLDFAMSLDASGVKATQVDLLIPATGAATLTHDVISNLQRLVAVATVDALTAADIKMAASFHRRDAVCAVSRGPATVRTMRVVRFVVTPRIQTRWVDMWRDFRKDVEWPQM